MHKLLIAILLASPAAATACGGEHPVAEMTASSARSINPCTRFVGQANAADDNLHGLAPDMPWLHIQYAVDQANAPGSYICVESGTYPERVLFGASGTLGSPITLARHPDAAPGSVVIDGTTSFAGYPAPENQAAVTIYNKAFITLTGLNVINGGNTTCSGPGCVVAGLWIEGSNHIVVSSNTISGVNPPAGFDQIGIPLLLRSLDAPPAPTIASTQVSIFGNTFSDSDTENSQFITGLLQISGDVHDFEIRSNTFRDNNSLGVETAGNQYGHEHAAYGVITDNVFDTVGQTSSFGPTYAVYLQATEQMLVERNFFNACGYGVGVTTEPPVNPADFFISTNTWIRDNLYLNTLISDLVAGAYPTNAGVPPYRSVSNVYFTSNTVFRPGPAGSGCPVYVPATSTAHLLGDTRFADNIVFSSGCLLRVDQALDPPAIDYNEWGSVTSQPFLIQGTGMTFATYAATTHQDAHGFSVAPTGAIFSGPLGARTGFHLKPGAPTPPIDAGGAHSPVSWGTYFGVYTPGSERDQYGGVRVAGVRIDLGADEF